jgi:DNA transposition AAA+ family ATPase
MLDYIVAELLRGKPRPIFIDEADYCFRHFEIVDALRDVYDLTKCPVILIGMENIARAVRSHERISRRITQWIEFRGLDLEDTTKVAQETCEVEISPCLLQYVHRETFGNIGRIIIALEKIERFAKAHGHDGSITAAIWGERPLYFDQPTFGKGPKYGTSAQARSR